MVKNDDHKSLITYFFQIIKDVIILLWFSITVMSFRILKHADLFLKSWKYPPLFIVLTSTNFHIMENDQKVTRELKFHNRIKARQQISTHILKTNLMIANVGNQAIHLLKVATF